MEVPAQLPVGTRGARTRRLRRPFRQAASRADHRRRPGGTAVVAQALAEAGLASIEAASGTEGIEAAREHRPAAIILDIIMPHQDGWSVLRSLKGDPELCEIPVILATILADRELGLSLGAVEYLTKPIDKENADPHRQRPWRRRARRARHRRRRGLAGLHAPDPRQERLVGARGRQRRARPRADAPDAAAARAARSDDAAKWTASRHSTRCSNRRNSRAFRWWSSPRRTCRVNELKWLRERAVAVVNKGANSRKQLVKALERQIALTGPSGFRAGSTASDREGG